MTDTYESTLAPAVRPLLGAYLALSWLTVAALATFAAIAPTLDTPQAWFRAVIVAGTSVLTFIIAGRAAKGRGRALLRLRIIVPVILIAIIAVLLFLPLPLWMIIEQAVCGLLLLITAVLVIGPTLRAR
jgi:hypothetical protein